MNRLIHILHLEDDPVDAELIQARIEGAGLTCRITCVKAQDEFEAALRQGGYDIVLADFQLPMYDGMSALRLAQKLCPDIPFIFVSGKMGEEAVIEGLTEGATDYVLKQSLSRLALAIPRALDEADNRRERRRAEKERQIHLWFLENLDWVNRAMQGTNDIDQMMGNVLDVVLTIFDCDRVGLIYPCDPEAASWRVPMERTRPEYPGAHVLAGEIPMDPGVARKHRTMRASDGPVKFGPGSEYPLPEEVAERFGFQSLIGMALYPKVGKPWEFMLQQCSYPRVWTPEEERLLQEIGRRLADSLTSLLSHRNLHESERRLARAESMAHVGWWDRDYAGENIALSNEASRIFGLPVDEQHNYDLDQWHERWKELIHPEDRSGTVQAIEEALRGGPPYDVEYRVIRPNGETRFLRSHGDVTWDESGQPQRMFGIMQDITQLQQAEDDLRQSREAALKFSEELATLQEVTNELSQAETTDDLCRQAVQLGRSHLGFDRVSIWFIDEHLGILRGSFGTDEHGELRDERNAQIEFRHEGLAWHLYSHKEPMALVEYRTLHDHMYREVGEGDNAVAALWDGDKVTGIISVDNLFSRQPIWERQLEVLRLYATTLGHLITQKRAEEARHASETRFRAFVNNASDAFFLHDDDEFGTILDVNDQACKSLGYSREELLGRTMFDFDQSINRSKAKPNRERLNAGEVLVFDTIHRRKDGAEFPVEVRVRPFVQGGRLFAVSLARDITKRKEAEEKIHRSEQRYRQVFENSPISIWEEDFSEVKVFLDNLKRDGVTNIETYFDQHPETVQQCAELVKIVDVNQAALTLHAAASKEELFTGLSDTFTPESFETFRQELVCLWNGGLEMTRDAAVKTLTGDPRYVTVYFTVCPGYEETLSKVYVSLVDISERRRMEEELAEREREFRTLAENSPDNIARYDVNYRALYINPTLAKTMGRPVPEMLGTTPVEANLIDEAREYQDKISKVFKTGKDDEMDLVLPDRGEGVRYHNIRFVAERDIDGAITGVQTIGRDFTERKQAEEAVTLFRTLIDHTNNAIEVIDPETGCFLDANEQAYQSLGYTREEFLNLTVYDIDPMMSDQSGRKALEEIIHTGSLVHESLHRRKDGSTFPVEININNIRLDRDYLVTVVHDITERKQAEEERQTHLWFLESLEQVNRAMQGTNDLEQMMSDVLDRVLAIFDCDRAYLMYPCDPDAPSWFSPMERTRPEYPGILALGMDEVPMDAEVARTLRLMLDTAGPVKFGPGTPNALPGDVLENFDIQSFMSMALYPKVDKPWQFGIHQCSYARIWTPEEERLLQEIGQRLADALTSLLAHRHLQESEERYRALYLDNPSMFFTLNSDGEIISVNAFGASQLGYTIHELEGQSVLNVFYEGDRTAVTTHLQNCLQNPAQINSWQLRKVRKDGSRLWVEEFARTVIDPNGAINILVVCQDITHRMEAETERERLLDQIQEKAQQVQYIIDTVPEGVILLSMDQSVTLTNPVAKQFLTLLVPEWENGRLTHLGQRPLTELLTSPPKGLWHEISSDDFVFEAIARPVEQGPENGGWVLVLRDVTQERDIQRRVQQQDRLAAVGQLAAGIAHDFNNILAVIGLYAEVISRTTQMPARTQEQLQTIEQQINRATDLIQQILDFSRQSVLDRQPLDLLPFIEKLVTLLERTLPEHILIELDYVTDTYFIQADPTRMQQVMMNLALNARDAMPAGGHLHFRLAHVQTEEPKPMTVQELPPGNWIQIEVTDSGSGIPPELLSNIFEPFFTTKEQGQGTGLGLAQVYGIVQQHEGYIDVVTETGQGTTFFLYFQAFDTGEEIISTPDRSELQMGQGQKILLVEDNQSTQKALRESLILLNYEVMAAANGREALAILEIMADDIDLVLSDVVMPEMGGVALFHAMRERNLAMPVVLLTGHPLGKELDNLKALGLAGWFAKPINLVNMSYLLAELLST
jgi:PAS domain S-box-containing protein